MYAGVAESLLRAMVFLSAAAVSKSCTMAERMDRAISRFSQAISRSRAGSATGSCSSGCSASASFLSISASLSSRRRPDLLLYLVAKTV